MEDTIQMKDRIKHIRTGDIILTRDMDIGDNTSWQLFVVLGQCINESRIAMTYHGKMIYEVAPAHIVNNSIEIEILQSSITIDDDDIRLVVGKTHRFRDLNAYDEALSEIIQDEKCREDIVPIEDPDIIVSLIRVLDDRAEVVGDNDIKKYLFNTIYRRDMDADTAEYCIQHLSEIGQTAEQVRNYYQIDWNSYMCTMKHLKEIIKKSSESIDKEK